MEAIDRTDNTVTPDELAAVEKVLAELNRPETAALALIPQFLMGFQMFRHMEANPAPGLFKRPEYFTVLTGLMFIGSCVEGLASKISIEDLKKVGITPGTVPSVIRFLKETYQLHFGIQDDAAADRFIESLN